MLQTCSLNKSECATFRIRHHHTRLVLLANTPQICIYWFCLNGRNKNKWLTVISNFKWLKTKSYKAVRIPSLQTDPSRPRIQVFPLELDQIHIYCLITANMSNLRRGRLGLARGVWSLYVLACLGPHEYGHKQIYITGRCGRELPSYYILKIYWSS